MSTSQRTFNQVKSILGKLDQRIDSLRAARSSPIPAAALIGGDRLIGQAVTSPAPSPASTFSPPPAPAPRSPFGRATPIRPTND